MKSQSLHNNCGLRP